MVDVDTKKILAVQVTDDRTGDSPSSFRCLTRPWRLRHGQERRRIPPPGRQTQDAACTGMPLTLPGNVTACGDRGVDSRIKLRVNSTARGKGTGDAWGTPSQEALGGSADSHVWKMSDDGKGASGRNGKRRSSTAEMAAWRSDLCRRPHGTSGCSARTCR